MATVEGNLVREWRQYFGLTLERLGTLCPQEKGRADISNIENGRNGARVETLLNIIGGLERAPTGFSFGSDDGMRLSRFFLGPIRNDAQNALTGAARIVVHHAQGRRR